MSLCIPMLEVLLHTIIDELRVRKGNVFKMEEEGNTNKMWKKESFWVNIARIWLPIAYLMVAFGIFVSGIINTVTSG